VSVGQLVDLFGGILAVLGPVINGINQINGQLERLGISPGILQLIGKLGDAGDATGTFSRHTAGATVAIGATTVAINGEANSLGALNAVMRTNINENVALYDANTQVAQALRDASKAIDDNGRGMSVNTEKGRENRTTLARLAGTLNSQYDAYVKVNGAGQAADAVMRSNRESFIKVATAASGSSAKARALADDLLGIPSVKPKITLLDNASGKIDNVINRLAAVRSKTVTLSIAVRQSGDASALRKQSLPAFSANQHFGQTTGDAGMSRTGGPTKVDVAQTLQVLLDGKPFYSYTDQAIVDSEQRASWRRKVGPR
jgi:ribosomal protein S9